jgi:hypothetical protein
LVERRHELSSTLQAMYLLAFLLLSRLHIRFFILLSRLITLLLPFPASFSPSSSPSFLSITNYLPGSGLRCVGHQRTVLPTSRQVQVRSAPVSLPYDTRQQWFRGRKLQSPPSNGGQRWMALRHLSGSIFFFVSRSSCFTRCEVLNTLTSPRTEH